MSKLIKWTASTLGDVTEESTNRHGHSRANLQVYGVDRAVGLTSVPKYASEDLSRYKRISPGMFAYNPMRLNIGSIGYCSQQHSAGLVSPDYVVFRCLEERIDPDFMRWLIRGPDWRAWVELSGVGSVRVRIYYRELARMPLILPPIAEQRAIAHILNTLNDKIELNLRMNATLEAISQALFKSWFVDFDLVKAKAEGRELEGMSGDTAVLFPSEFQDSELGPIPKGWAVKTLGECCDIARGASPRPIQHFMGDDIPWIKIADATGAGGPFIFETKEKIIASGKEKSVYLEPGSLILSNSATCGLPFFLEIAGCIHDGWLYFENYREITPAYLFHALNRMSERLVHEADGSVQKNLNTALVSKQRIIVPSKDIGDLFEKIHEPLLSTMRENTRQNQLLANIRDTLLPKLISGQLRISGIEKWQGMLNERSQAAD